MVICKQEKKQKLTMNNLLTSRILTQKVDKFPLDSVVYKTCCELVTLNRYSMDDFMGKTVFTLTKKCHKFFCPKERKVKKLSSYRH